MTPQDAYHVMATIAFPAAAAWALVQWWAAHRQRVLDPLEGAIASGYVVETDVDSPTRYYARILRRQGPLLERYAREVGYQRAWALVERMGRTP